MKACLWLILLPLAIAALQYPQEEATNAGPGCIEERNVGYARKQHCAAPKPNIQLSTERELGPGITTEDGEKELKKVLLEEAEVARLNNMSYTDLDPLLIARLVHYKLMALTDAEAENVPGPWKSWGKVKIVCNPSRFAYLTSSRYVAAPRYTMKAFLWLTLLSLAAVAYGASVAPQVITQKPVLSKQVEAEVLEKTGKSLETLGRLLQGNEVSTKENQDELLEIMEALSKGDIALSDEASEYIWPIIIRGVAQCVIAHVVHMKLNKRG